MREDGLVRTFDHKMAASSLVVEAERDTFREENGRSNKVAGRADVGSIIC